MKQSIDDQITTVELLLLSQRGHVDNLKRLASKGERQPIHVEDAEAKLPKIRAVLDTLKWLKTNEEAIKTALKAKK